MKKIQNLSNYKQITFLVCQYFSYFPTIMVFCFSNYRWLAYGKIEGFRIFDTINGLPIFLNLSMVFIFLNYRWFLYFRNYRHVSKYRWFWQFNYRWFPYFSNQVCQVFQIINGFHNFETVDSFYNFQTIHVSHNFQTFNGSHIF